MGSERLMEYLDEKLKKYKKEGIYPFHMPGHKRNGMDFINPYQIDITEIEGFDNLHHAQDILKEAQTRANDLFKAKSSYYLVNGSTCGLLSAICALTQKQDKIIMARNCHKSVYHAVLLQELKVEYVYPNITKQGIQASITPESIACLLEENPDTKAVILTSPTYDGVVSDIKEIAKIVHKYQIPLIVDEAHGSHFGFHEAFPKSALMYGADLVIHSLHKTFPCLTQTALLHVNSNLIDENKIKLYLNIFETSSPSYVLMASMEQCIRYIKEHKNHIFTTYVKNLEVFKEAMQKLEKIEILDKHAFLQEEIFDFDISKILIGVRNLDMSGNELLQELRKKYKIQLEMASMDYATALTSVMDTKEGFSRLSQALTEIDFHGEKKEKPFVFLEKLYQKNKKEMEISMAFSFPKRSEKKEQAIGQVCAEYIYLYPPGIPFLVPGEVITKEHVTMMDVCQTKKMEIEGLEDATNQRINIVNF